MHKPLAALGLLLLSSVAGAQSPAPERLLEEMTRAFHDTDYRGQLFYVHDGNISSLEVVHGVIDGTEYEKLVNLDGELAALIRQGNQVVCLHPDNTLTRLGARASVGPFGLHERLARSVPDQYQVIVDGAERVAGRSAWQLRLVPMDKFRYGYRLWIDDASRLLLRAETVDNAGRSLERFEFVNLELDPELSPEVFEVPAAMAEQSLEPVDPDQHPQGRLRLEPAWLPAGFVSADGDLRLGSGDRHPVSARTYTDGLAAFTLFVQRAETSTSGDITHQGPTVALSREFAGDNGNRYLVTLVGEVPAATAQKVLADLSLRSTP